MMVGLEERIKAEFLIIGSGIAGLRAAIELSRRGRRVVILTKSKLDDGANTYYAQGGIAAVDLVRVESGADSYESHIEDTMSAGDGLCSKEIVERFVRRAYPDAIRFLMDSGVAFTKATEGDYPYELHSEGGHDSPRIYCVKDYTGRAVEERLAEIVSHDPNITVLEHHAAVNLITSSGKEDDECLGAYVLNTKRGEVLTFEAGVTILATGGAGRVFQYTSNPENATGDGIAMAYRVGALIVNMEFVQFHPTVLYEPNPENPAERRFLLSEALRGAGGILTLEKDSLEDFVLAYDTRGSHATRDIVARAIDTELKRNTLLKHVWLNVTPQVTGKTEESIRRGFEQIYEHCLKKGIDITKEPIPAIPAAHYTCGGVVVSKDGLVQKGEGNYINGLYAIGEVSYTGLMGANRLASNSLPEAALYGLLAVEHALENYATRRTRAPLWRGGSLGTEVDAATRNAFWDNTRSTMTNLCGIDRNEQRLSLAVHIMDGLVNAADEIYQHFYPTREIIELRNLTLVGKLIAESALNRRESRGGHYRSDYPQRDDENYREPTIIRAGEGIQSPKTPSSS